MPGIPSPSLSELTIAAFDDLTSNAAQVQESLLLSILQNNASCEYLRQFNVPSHLTNGHSQSMDISTTFRKLLPLVTHADIKPYLQRIANGERSSIITSTPLEALCLSSGTTEAKEKHLPYHKGLNEGTLEIARIAGAFRDRAYPISKDARILEFLFCGKFSTTRGGMKLGTATTHMIRSEVFKQRQSNNGLNSCSPHTVVLGSDCRQVMYCHLLCGLLYSASVEVASAPFAYTLVEALRTLESEWDSLCHDLLTGTLNCAKVTDATLRAAVGEILTPNPRLAGELFSKCRALACDGWRGVIETLWPHCKYVLSILTGAMEAYVDKLRHYAGERIPLVSADYAATEGWIGVNVEPRSSPPSSVSFTVLPSLAFFEFIPLRRSIQEQGPAGAASAAYEEGHPVGLTDVKVGQEYEIVMTTRWGLYRYRLGDVVRVTGFYNAAPQVSYVCRKNVLLSINIDKNTEKDLKAVVSTAAKRLAEVSGEAMQLVDYTSYADRRTAPGHYVIFWEVDVCKNQKTQNFVSKQQLQTWLGECATLMDRAFVEPGYVTSRKMNTIGALELCLVQRGTFAKLLDRFMSRGAAITQYKTPRCIVSPDALSILRESACTTLLSAATFQ
ncbi:hypothetical protein GOP47_0024650 [Adiantum capillus-veneris]|uniref:Uncharacterized protein n=1 Tax=Adiantum capillus-veneris TaxID=13818 RepID=A0A9D4U2I3_ADICA|nr:hypothetical protein GOP47_0024650 [Adiantum capillus-veneris]